MQSRIEHVYETIRLMHDQGYRHITKGYVLNQMDDEAALKSLSTEIIELAMHPGDPTEMADVLACLFHYAYRHGWSLDFLAQEMAVKLGQRFTNSLPSEG